MKSLSIFAPILVGASAFGQFTLIQDFETNIVGISTVYATGEIPTQKLFRTDNTAGSGIEGFLPGNSFPGTIPGANGTIGYLELDLIAGFAGPSFSFYQGPRAQWNTPTNPLDPFVSGAGHRVAVYIDDADSSDALNGGALYPENSGWFWQPGLTEDDTTTRIVAGGFGVRSIDIGGGDLEWFAMADGNARGYDSTVAGPGNNFQLSQGWYNFETKWVADLVNGTVDEINRIYTNNLAAMVFEFVREDVALLTDVGGLGNVSIGSGSEEGGNMGDIPSSLSILGIDEIGTVIPETNAAFIVVLSGAFLLGRRRNRR